MYAHLLQSLSKHVSLTAQETDLLISLFELRSIKKKGFLLREGEVFRHATFINQGCLTMYSTDKGGKNHVVQIAVEGWWAGDIYSFLTQKPSEYFVEALEDSEVLCIGHKQLEELYHKVPKMERYFRILVQNAYISFQNRTVSSMSTPAPERYLSFLEKHPGLEQRIPLYVISSYLGIRPEVLSRIRKKLAKGFLY